MASLATRQAIEQAARQATEQAVRQASEQAARQAGEQAARAAADQGADLAAQQAARQAAEQASRQAAEQAARQAGEQAARQAAEQAAEQAARRAGKGAGDMAPYAAAAAAAGLGLYTYYQANQAAEESNNTPRGITKIEYSSASSRSIVKITFTPAMRILQTDDLTFRGTKTTPSIDGPATVKSVFSNSQIEVDFGSTVLTVLTPGGEIDVRTTVAAQAAASVNDAGENLGNAAGGGLSGFLNGLFPFLKDMGDSTKWIIFILCCLCCIGVLGFGVYMSMK